MTLNISYLSTNNSLMTQEIFITSDDALSVPNTLLHNQKILGTWIIVPSEADIYELGYLKKRSNSFLTMLASEKVLSKDWDTPDEDEAWENL